MFVVFEGIDGSGKTTISNQVAEQLRASGLDVQHLRADGKFVSAVSEAIRELGRDARNLALTPQAEFLLYVARDVQLIDEALRPALATADVVLADRFLFTAEVLARAGRRLADEFTAPILAAAAGGLEPDLVILVDVDPVLARARRKARKLQALDRRPPSRKGLSGAGLQHRLRRGYLDRAARDPARWIVVDNDAPVEDTVARVTRLIRDAHACGAAAAIEHARKESAATTVRPIAASAASVAQALERFLAWVDERMQREPRVAAYLLGGLFGPGVDERRRALAARVPEAVLAALCGRHDQLSWDIRATLVAEHPIAVLRSISGIPNSELRARALREALERDYPTAVLSSIATFADELSWAQRERWFEQHPDAVVGSLGGLDDARSWSLRERWLEPRKRRIESEYDAARVAAKSVHGLGGDAAHAVRKRARAAAPVAALASLFALEDETSWSWREEYVSLAPKVVMATIKRLRAAEAWQMRQRVAADCKEAIDSIQDLDDEPAWALREVYADTWPSTVVKSLGPLADGGRGRGLLLRVLAAHPNDVSLLRHVSAVALGIHHAPSVEG